MISIEIEHDSVSFDTSTPASDDDWDRANTSTDHSIGNEFYSSKYGDLFIKDEPKIGDKKYVVYVIYSTGDSFGHDAGYGIEWLALFDSEEEAQSLVRLIEKNDSRGQDGFSYIDHNGKEITMGYAPWQGYFESLDNADYKEVRYGGKRK